MQTLPTPLAPLAAYRQFMLYRLVPDPVKPGKFTKLPCNLTGAVCNAHDPQHWTDATTACAAATAAGNGWGVAFVFTAGDPFFFLDIDGALGADGQWSAVAQQLCVALAGAAVEVSQSGKGLHIFGRAQPMHHGCKNIPLGLELYTEGRFVALTGLQAMGDASLDCTAALSSVVAAYFPFVPGQSAEGDFTLTTEPVPEWRGPTDDEDLLRRALASKPMAAKFGANVATFRDLFERNTEVLALAYPHPEGYDASSVDAALVAQLAFWTGRHGERILRLMQRSALLRDKWDRPDYLPRTITEICSRPGQVCQDQPLMLPDHLQGAPVATVQAAPAGPVVLVEGLTAAAAVAGPMVAGMQLRGGTPFANAAALPGLFKGCVYIKDEGRILVPGSGRVNKERFDVVFGGYTINMDDTNTRMSRSAWEAFTQHPVMKPAMVDTICFRPDLEAGAIVTDAGRVRVNIYEAINVPRKQGDLMPFWTHLFKLFPDERDRMIFMSYMAACVQHKGFKFQWAPLVQGVPGNGKTLFTRCVAEALGRRYVHWPKASKLSKEFNAWMVGKLLYGVEDIYTPHGKEEVLEELKPMITGGDGLEIEGKGVDQVSMDICGNFMFNSNHKNAVIKSRNDRRFCIFYTPQQQYSDLARDGMEGDYFPNLYNWLKADGYAIVAELLHTFVIPDEFNPAKDCHRAPSTSSTEEAIGVTQGGIEQEIFEAVAQGRPGFAGGWISSKALELMLDGMRQGQRITRQRRRDMLAAMGYELHRALHDGRVNNAVMPDNCKTQLFIKLGHPDAALTVAADVAKAYTAAQKP